MGAWRSTDFTNRHTLISARKGVDGVFAASEVDELISILEDVWQRAIA